MKKKFEIDNFVMTKKTLDEAIIKEITPFKVGIKTRKMCKIDFIKAKRKPIWVYTEELIWLGEKNIQ